MSPCFWYDLLTTTSSQDGQKASLSIHCMLVVWLTDCTVQWLWIVSTFRPVTSPPPAHTGFFTTAGPGPTVWACVSILLRSSPYNLSQINYFLAPLGKQIDAKPFMHSHCGIERQTNSLATIIFTIIIFIVPPTRLLNITSSQSTQVKMSPFLDLIG